MSGESTRGWTVIVPMVGSQPEADAWWRSETLRAAIELDTIEAVAAANSVHRIVIVADGRANARLDGLGARTTAEWQLVSIASADRTAAIELGRRHIHRTWGACSVAVVAPNLPFLRPAELDSTLAEAARFPRAVLAAADERSAALLTAREHSLLPSDGIETYAGHLALGIAELTRAGSRSLQRDVDSLDHLAAALAAVPDGCAGAAVAPRTRAVLRRLSSAGVAPVSGWRSLG